MLDGDVAMLYHYETKNVNKMWFQIGTLNKKVNNEKVQDNIYQMSILNREYQCLQGY